MYTNNVIINIPVESKKRSDFVHRPTIDPYHQLCITDQIYIFLEKPLKNLGCNLPKDLKLELSELIYNCYDAYAKNKLIIGQSLKIKVDIQERDDTVVVNIQDNGSGFANFKSDRQYTLSEIKPDIKTREGSAGGEGIGLTDLRNILQANNIGLLFSNSSSSSPGAVVTMEFSKQQRPDSPGYTISF